MSGQQRLVATRIDVLSNRAHRENETLLLRKKERSSRRRAQVPARKKHLSRDFESPHFSQAQSNGFSSQIPTFVVRSVGYHVTLLGHWEAGARGDYARVERRSEEEEPTWRKVHLHYYEVLYLCLIRKYIALFSPFKEHALVGKSTCEKGPAT
jgi:hypothetical protein